MAIAVASISQKNPSWVEQAFQEYCTRCIQPWAIEHIHINLIKRVSGQEHKARDKESEQLTKHVKSTDYVIGLDPGGQQFESQGFAQHVQNVLDQGRRPFFIIGAPEGLAPGIRQICHCFWSLSQLTMPHTLAKVVVAEQLFRAWSITHNHPYHRQ